MRLSLLSLLLLSAASPALAQRVSDEADSSEPRMERSSQPDRGFRASEAPRPRSERFERAERPERAERQAERAERREERADRREERAPPPEAPAATSASFGEVARAAAQQRREERARPGREMQGADRNADGWRGRQWREGNNERGSRNRDVPHTAGSPVFGADIPGPDTVTRPRRDVSTGSAVDRQVRPGDLRGRIAAEGLRRDRIEREEWRRELRNDRRYDWRRHRDRDRSRFQLSLYIDPFGWRYRDWDVGWRLPARYYSSRYWLNDPWEYRLPPVYGPYRWVRYYNDVLLIDIRDGRVLDRIQRFFW